MPIDSVAESNPFCSPAWRRALLALMLALLVPARGAHADEGVLRERFLSAERAAERGDRDEARRLRAELGDYALLPYLDAALLGGRLEDAGGPAVEEFLRRHGATPVGARVRTRWLDILAERGEWRTFLALDDGGGGTERACQRARARLATGARRAALEGVDRLWVTPRSLPDVCDPVLDAWRAAGRLDRELAWQRFAAATRAGEAGLARYLERYLARADMGLAHWWRDLRADIGGLATARFPAASAQRLAPVALDLVRVLARADVEAAAAAWELRRAELPAAVRGEADVEIAVRLARERNALARPWLERLPESAFAARREARHWRLAVALREGDWRAVRAAVAALPAGERASDEARYWGARAARELGDDAAARAGFEALARERSYYGFLAADRLGRPYRLGHEPLRPDAAAIARVAARPAVRRALELNAIGREIDARREWHWMLRDLPPAERPAAAALAHREGWHHLAILTAARAERYDDLELRFPVAHRDGVLRAASARGIDPAWVFAVIRQESAFLIDARSSAGALGLMQILPSTGRSVARTLSLPRPSWADLLDPPVSVDLGSAYLAMLLDRFDRDPLHATAAYNAGPGRVARWRLDAATMPADVWVESIPFTETRRYVQRVLEYQVIYAHRLGRPEIRLSDRMSPLAAGDAPSKPSH
ncbi:MAG: transglycosylase SLT domain-containing protein [Ectothiorhodospiraceae bacterium]|nr:transglycosylase SLT domain-containing protein [Ectothiorhodospiraceae bacterium]